jgi:hypothetical protein
MAISSALPTSEPQTLSFSDYVFSAAGSLVPRVTRPVSINAPFDYVRGEVWMAELNLLHLGRALCFPSDR